MATKSRKQNRQLSMNVVSGEELKNAMTEQYGIIVIHGECAGRVAKNIRDLRSSSNFTAAVLTFPLSVPALLDGIVGRPVMVQAMHYEIATVEDSKVVLKRK